MKLALPAPLVRGDRVAVVAPASPFPRDDFFRGLAWLRARYDLVVRGSILAREGYLAGDDARRADELASAMRARDVKAVIAARGGYGVMRVVDDLPWDAFAERPKWLVGFSDVTALHVAAIARGVACVHASNVTGLAASAPAARFAFLSALEDPAAPLAWRGLRVVHAGPPREGPLVGGNLALIEAMAAAGRLALPDGCVLALEDVTERPYRVDRMLTSLLLGGYLARASAIVFGAFTRCDPGPDGVAIDDVLRDRTRALGVPVLAGAPFGHDAVNHPFVMGPSVRVDGAAVTRP